MSLMIMKHQVLWTSPPRGWKDSCHPPVVIPRIEQLPQRSQEKSRKNTVVYDAKYGRRVLRQLLENPKEIFIFICLVMCQIYTSPPTIMFGKKLTKPFYLEYDGFLYHRVLFNWLPWLCKGLKADTGRASKLLGWMCFSDWLGMWHWKSIEPGFSRKPMVD